MSLYYSDDFVTLYHGDCLTDHREWLDADVLVTDPPYGMSIDQRAMRHSNGKMDNSLRVSNAVAGDQDATARDDALKAWGKRPAIMFGTWRVSRPKGTKQRLIWHKANTHPNLTRAPWYATEEEIYIIGAGFGGEPERNVYITHELRSGKDGLAAMTGHPTPKPIGLMEGLIRKCPDGVIADPFAGSGATLMAAKNLRRQVVGVELEERYCEIIAKRCAQEVFDFGLSA
jgi:site-specific DNA-methyltransferase (adenine-specific)